MARIIDSADLNAFHTYDPVTRLWLYNALDSAVTFEVWRGIREHLDDDSRRIYRWELSEQGPAFTMCRRGMLVDKYKIAQLRGKIQDETDGLRHWLDQITEARSGFTITGPKGLSHKKLKEFFYGALELPPIYKYERGERKLTTNREAMEQFRVYFRALPFVVTIEAIADNVEILKVLNKRLGPRGRFYYSFGVGATDTGRWASYASVFGHGDNIQNKTPDLREMFIADPGMKMGAWDQAQAESRGVAYLSGDPAYIEACESGDVHTTVAQMIFDIPESQARDPYYRHFSYRDMCKRAGHLTNYMGSPFKLSNVLQVPKGVAAEFQRLYFARFPGIPKWHLRLAAELQETGVLITPMGRKRCFFGRRNDDATLRKAVAFLPQSLISEINKIGLMRVWRYMDTDMNSGPNTLQVLQEGHDGTLFQYPEDRRDLAEKTLEYATVEFEVDGIARVIPVDLKAGYDWKNMEDWGSEEELAQVRTEPVHVLDREAG